MLHNVALNSEDADEMPHNVAFHQGLHCKGKKDLQTIKYINLLKKLQPDTPRYVQWSIPSLLYQTKRKSPLVYEGLICFKAQGKIDGNTQLSKQFIIICKKELRKSTKK